MRTPLTRGRLSCFGIGLLVFTLFLLGESFVVEVCADVSDPVDLRFAPVDTVLETGSTGRLSIMMDQALTVRTLDVTVAYDTTVIRTLDWHAGNLFDGLFLFKGFEEDVPGVWHGYVIVMGSEIFATGPGELFVWEYTGVADGITSVEIVPTPPNNPGVFLSDQNGDWYESVDLSGATVRVGSGPTSVPDHTDINLIWDQHWQQVPYGQAGTLTVQLDQAIALRTVEVTIAYDPQLIAGVTVEPGSVFDDVPCFIWEAYEEEVPGVWHGFAAIIGGDCQTTGPGDLLVWRFTAGQQGGLTSIDPQIVTLFAPDASRIPNVSLDRAYVAVVDQVSDTPVAPKPANLSLAPNPFNPTTQITMQAATDGPADLEIFDVNGRSLGRIWSGHLGSQAVTVNWNGCALQGTSQASGVYFFRLSGQTFKPIVTRGVLLR